MFQRMENDFVCILLSKLPMNTNLSHYRINSMLKFLTMVESTMFQNK